MATLTGLPYGWLKRTMELLKEDGKDYSQSHISNIVRRYRNNPEVLEYANRAIEELNKLNYEREQKTTSLRKSINSQRIHKKLSPDEL